MLQWIANQTGAKRAPILEEDPPVHTIVRDEMRADVFIAERCCGHLGYLVELQRWDRHDDEWRHAYLVFDDHLQEATELLSEAREWIGKQPVRYKE